MQTEVVEKLYTASKYLAFEERAKNKYEYYNGKIIKMPGTSFTHNQIATNIAAILFNSLYDKSFIVTNSDTKIHIPKLGSFVYPDAVVVFEKPILYEGRTDVILNPLLIVEVASRSTKKYDRTTKFEYYKTLPSFKEYVLIEQAQPWAVASYKIADRTWKDTEANTLEDSLYLASVDCTIDIKKVYHGIQFTKSNNLNYYYQALFLFPAHIFLMIENDDYGRTKNSSYRYRKQSTAKQRRAHRPGFSGLSALPCQG